MTNFLNHAEPAVLAAALVGAVLAQTVLALGLWRALVWALGLLKQDNKPRPWCPADLKRLRKDAPPYSDGRDRVIIFGSDDRGRTVTVGGRMYGEIGSDHELSEVLTVLNVDPDLARGRRQ
jgi:hypothetical protein